MTRLGAVLAGGIALLAGPPLGITTYGVRAESDTSGSTALFSDEASPVATWTRSTFISSVLESDTPAMVMLYHGSDCRPQCEELSGMIETASEKLTSWGVSVGAVDLSTEPKLAKELGMRNASPSPMAFKVYHSASTANPYGGLPVRSETFLTAFQDARTLQKRVLSAVPDLVVSVDVDMGAGVSALREALSAREEEFAAVLFTDAGKASPALRILASGLSGRVAAIQARLPKKKSSEEDEDEDEEAKEPLSGLLEGVFSLPGGIPSVPALVLVDKQSATGKPYVGAVDDAKAMLAFIRDGAGISESSSGSTSSSTSSSGEGTGAPTGKTEFGAVLRVDPDSLAELAEKGTEALVLAFVNGGDTSVIPGWSEATKGLQGQIRPGVVDCEAHPSACQGAAKFRAPHLRVYPHGNGDAKDSRSVPSVLAASEIKEAVAEAEASLPDIVAVLPAGRGSQETQPALQAFINTVLVGEKAPLALFVLSKREEPNLLVKTIAAEFQEAKVGTLFISQPDEATMASVQVKKLPAMLLMFPPPKPLEESNREMSLMTAVYSPLQFGALNHRHVSDFVLSHLSNVGYDGFVAQVRRMKKNAELNREKLTLQLERFLNEIDNAEQDAASWGEGGDDFVATTFEGISEATSETWTSLAGEGTVGANEGVRRPVGVFLLDRYSESFDSALKAAELAVEQAARLAGTRSARRIVWVDAPCQEEFSRTLGVSDASEIPALVVFSPQHQKSARFVGAWEADSLASFLGRALGGREPMFPIGDNAPSLVPFNCSKRAAPAWLAGGDGEEAGGMENDDMGDFMAEILAEEAKAKRALEEEVARDMEEMKETELPDDAPKKKTKVVKRKKKKKTARSEL